MLTAFLDRIMFKRNDTVTISPIIKMREDSIYDGNKLNAARMKLNEMGIFDVKPLINVKKRKRKLGSKRRME